VQKATGIGLIRLTLVLAACSLSQSYASCAQVICQASVPTDISLSVGSPLWQEQHTDWLPGLTPNATVQTAPPLFDLMIHTGQHLMLKRLLDFQKLASLPSWISRYSNASAQVAVYQALVAGEGTHYLVLIPRSGDKTLAHWYTPDGIRTTFGPNGKFPAFTQTLDQQYRSVAAGDPQGELPASPKTAYAYLDAGSGLLKTVTDEQGRVTTYTWDVPTRRALSISQSGPGGQGLVKRSEFQYTHLWKYWYVSEIAERALDGLGGESLRRTRYSYSEYSKPEFLDYDVRLTAESREVVGTGGDANSAQWLSTFYTKDKDARVVGVRHVAGLSPEGPRTEPDTVISYASSPLYGGALKITTQGTGNTRRERAQHFDQAGLLRREDVWSFNPVASGDASQGQMLTREYGYDALGQLTSLTEPSGKRVATAYDDLGRVASKTVFMAGAQVRTTTYEYDVFNRQSAEITPEASGPGYKYPEVRRARSVTALHTITKDGATASLPATVETTVSVGGTLAQSTTETYDTQGRLLSSARSADGHKRGSSFQYGGGQASAFALVLPDGRVDETRVRTAVQPSDRVSSQTVAGVTTEFTYDLGGNVAVETIKNGLVTGHDRGAGTDKGRAITRDRRLLRGFDGWGNKASEAAFTGAADKPSIEAVSVFNRYGTGELRDSWAGTPDNVTAYAYGGGADTGRLVNFTQGVGLDAARSSARTVRSGVSSSFDAFGRPSGTLSITGLKSATSYDTLDRPAKEQRADGVTVETTYSASGTPRSVAQSDINGTVSSLRDIDALGRITREQVSAGDQKYEIARSFDPYDRVLKARDSRLDMNRPGDDQATYFVYDALGHPVKQLGAAMSTNGAYYDDRRPYTESSYDGLGRKTEQRVLLSGVITPAQLTPSSASDLLGQQVAVTRYAYDDADHLVSETDPAGFVTARSYDGAGNLVTESRDLNKPGDAAGSSTAYGYDGAGRRTESINALGARNQVAFNTLGLPIAETDALGNTRRVMTYTADGLLTGVAQPKPGVLKAQALSGAEKGMLSQDFVWTARYQYGSGQRTPTKSCEARLSEAADAASACTTVQYDAAGHPQQTTLADGSVTKSSYSPGGQVLSETGADGRTTTYSYNTFGQMVAQKTTANDLDRAAGLTGGLNSSFERDLLGRVTAQTVNGVRTAQTFNSLGLLTAQSRAALSGTANVPQALNAYRLDGQLVAQSTAGYVGALRGPNARSAIETQTGAQARPDVSAGALTLYSRNPRGDLLQTSVIGAAKGAPVTLMTAKFQVNALGLPVQRDFSGDPALYRAPVGSGSAYATHWTYDAAGHLTGQWDEAGGQKANVQSVAYTPAGQIQQVSHDLRVLGSGQLGGGQILAASAGSTAAKYDARGDLIETRVQAAGTDLVTQYAYHQDGQLAQASVQGGGQVVLDQYDALGRLTGLTVTAASQPAVRTQSLTPAPNTATVKTSYAQDGTRTRQLLAPDGRCLYAQASVIGLNTLAYSAREWNGGCSGTPSQETLTTYSSTGLPTAQKTVTTSAKAVTTLSVSRTFDALLNPASGQQTTLTTGEGASSKAAQWTGAFTPDGRLQTLSVQGDGAASQTNFLLDALGRKVGLAAVQDRMNGWRQYFDADGRVSLLEGPSDSGTSSQVAYRYDLGGTAALSSESATAAGRVTARAYQVQGLPGQPQMLSLQAGTTTRTRDVTYTLLEGVFGERWESLAPLGTAGLISGLAAPRPLSSAQFGLIPTEVSMPESEAGTPLTPLSVITVIRNLQGGIRALQAPLTLLPSQMFGLRPSEVRQDGQASGTTSPEVTAGTGPRAVEGQGSGGLGITALSMPTNGPSTSLLDELRRLQGEQRGALDLQDR
jgi:YD repeat-containing protein